MTIYGSYFSVRDSRPVIQIGRTDCATSTWVSDSMVTCVTGAGWAGGHSIAWHSEGSQDAVRSVAPIASHFSYDLPFVTAVFPATADQLGGVNITILGANFGLEPRHTQFRFLPQNLPELLEETWISDSSVRAKVQPGFGGVDTIEAKVGLLAKNTTTPSGAGYFGYDRSYVYRVQGPTPLNPAGGDALSISGRLFGTTPTNKLRLQVGKTEGPILVWTSDSAVEAVTPPGAGRNVPVYVSVNGLWAITNATVSYPAHTVTGVAPGNSAVQDTRDVMLYGSNFGPALEVQGKFGIGSPETNPGEQIRIGDTQCQTIAYSSTTSVRCRVAHGVGRRHDVSLRINGYASTLAASFSYDVPRTLTVTPSSYSPTTTVNTTLTITGRNFGSTEFEASVRVGVTTCGTSTWVSDSSIACYNGAAGLPLRGVGSVPVVVSVGGQWTPETGDKAVRFCYTAPVVTGVVPADAPASGGVPVTLFGSNFGAADYPITALLGDTACVNTEWRSDQEVVSKP